MKIKEFVKKICLSSIYDKDLNLKSINGNNYSTISSQDHDKNRWQQVLSSYFLFILFSSHLNIANCYLHLYNIISQVESFENKNGTVIFFQL